jgi:predicted transcriptional regulator
VHVPPRFTALGATTPGRGPADPAVDFQLHLESETVEHCHPSPPLCAKPTDSVRTVLRMLQEHRTGAAMVCSERRLVGVFTERDALRLLADGTNLDSTVAETMTRNPVTIRKSDTVARAISLMSVGGFRRLPIIDEKGNIEGVLKVSGLLHYLVEHFPKVVYTLPPEPHHKVASREGA